jgi:outer membrane protein assembly factor BamA
MLGEQTLTVAVQVNAGLSGDYSAGNTAAQAMYVNSKRRWNWGIVGGQVPYLSGGTQSGVGTIGNEPVQVDQTILHRQTDRSAALVIAYPFSRARRVEWQTGLSRVTFDRIVQTTAYSLRTGQRVADESETIPLADPLTLGTTSMALVYDTSVFGATSPVQGARYRLEATPTFGSINFMSALADYRRYFMPVSFYTIAVRGLHYGRYGSGGEDLRLSPLYLGYPSLVRGYDTSTISSGTCVAFSGCDLTDPLVGSRVLVGNVEFRFPLLRPFGASGSRMYGPMPMEVALFTDAGVAWSSNQKPTFFGGDREPVASGGIGLRTNLGGFAVGEFDFAYPFQGIGGWTFQFNLSPGF